MKRLIKNTVLPSFFVLGVGLGCSPASNYGAHNPEPFLQKSETFQYKMEQETPKLDLVFVMDNSKSMHTHVTNLAGNIKKFTEKFNPESVDLRVGVVTVSDSTRFKVYSSEQDSLRVEDAQNFASLRSQASREYRKAFPTALGDPSDDSLREEIFLLNFPGLYEADNRYAYFEDKGRSNVVLPAGVLRPVRTESGRDLERSYLDSEEERFSEELERTLLVTDDFHRAAPGRDDGWANLGSPVVEEVFSVLDAMVSPDVNLNWNRGFLRDDAHLAVVIVTDAEDSTVDPSTGDLMSADKIAGQLINYKEDRRKLSVYGVLSILGDGIESCETDGYRQSGDEFEPVRPARIISMIRKLNGSTYSLCSPDFGVELAAIGSDLVKRVYEENYFPLSLTPTSRNDIQVYVNDELLEELAWTYNNYSQSVSINTMYQTQAVVRIEYLTPNPLRLSSGELLPDGVGGRATEEQGH